jgi:hypothetical protein
MKLVSREVVFEINKITKTNARPGDVIVMQLDMSSMSGSQIERYIKQLREAMEQVFPDNKVVVLDSEVTISIVTITP